MRQENRAGPGGMVGDSPMLLPSQIPHSSNQQHSHNFAAFHHHNFSHEPIATPPISLPSNAISSTITHTFLSPCDSFDSNTNQLYVDSPRAATQPKLVPRMMEYSSVYPPPIPPTVRHEEFPPRLRLQLATPIQSPILTTRKPIPAVTSNQSESAVDLLLRAASYIEDGSHKPVALTQQQLPPSVLQQQQNPYPTISMAHHQFQKQF
jgi:hypothetical protein